MRLNYDKITEFTNMGIYVTVGKKLEGKCADRMVSGKTKDNLLKEREDL
jgi:hypothetical protein